MIPKVAARGSRVTGLLRYLYGPGKREEHVNPRLVAAWDGAGSLSRLEPGTTADGGRDFALLAGLLEQPVRAGRNPPRLPVWHCSVRNHASDRILTDAQWAHIAREMVAGAGLAPHGDDRAVRWVAVRHADDHIHIVATLVRQDRRTEWGRNERWKCQATARDLEERYGLYRVGPADRTSHRRPHSVEVNKARRTGRGEPARDRLRRLVRHAAAAAATPEEFVTQLRADNVQVRFRHSDSDPEQITGYAVALDTHTTADGKPVWYGGGRLAPDLTWPKLRTRWGLPRPAGGEQPVLPEVLEQAAEQIRAAAEDLHRATTDDPARAAAAAVAAADVLTVAARLMEGTTRGPLHRAAEALDRATREPYGRNLAGTRRVEGLRAMSRLLRVAGQLSDDPAVFQMLRLILDLSLLADALADLRDTQQRRHQARAARIAADLLAAAGAAPPVTGSTPPAPAPPSSSAPAPHRDPRRADTAAATRRAR